METKQAERCSFSWVKISDNHGNFFGLRDGSVTLLGGKVYWAGGSGVLTAFSFDNLRWQTLGKPLLGISMTHVAELADEKIYFYGGVGSTALVEYDTVLGAAREVETARTGPSGRRWMTAVFAPWRREIIYFGGIHRAGESRMNDTHAFNVDSQSWKELGLRGTPPQARTGHSAVIHEKKMYIYGGFNDDFEYLGDLWIAELSSLAAQTWSLVVTRGSLPTNRTVAALNNLNGRLVVFGGFCRDYNVRHAMSVFFPKTQEWKSRDGGEVRVAGSRPGDTTNHLSVTLSRGILYFTPSGIFLLSEE